MVALGMAVVGGCASDGTSAMEPLGDESEEPMSTSTGFSPQTPSPGESGAPVTVDDTTGNDASFIDPTGGEGGAERECDVWTQDCNAGEKCMPWDSEGGGRWDATRCVPLEDNADQPGDKCTVMGNGSTGLDSCDLGAMCYGVDPETNEGTCISMCEGTPDAPFCSDPDAFCSVTNDGVLSVCLPSCDPLLQTCESETEGCYWLPGDGGFVCAQDVSGEMGGAGDPCDQFTLNLCSRGLQCLPAAAVPGCEGVTSCCSVFCDTEEEEPGCLDGQECTPLFEAGDAPPGAETYGVCAIPA